MEELKSKLVKLISKSEDEIFKEINFITPVVILGEGFIAFNTNSFKLWGYDYIPECFKNVSFCETENCLYIPCDKEQAYNILYHLTKVCDSIQII